MLTNHFIKTFETNAMQRYLGAPLLVCWWASVAGSSYSEPERRSEEVPETLLHLRFCLLVYLAASGRTSFCHPCTAEPDGGHRLKPPREDAVRAPCSSGTVINNVVPRTSKFRSIDLSRPPDSSDMIDMTYFDTGRLHVRRRTSSAAPSPAHERSAEVRSVRPSRLSASGGNETLARSTPRIR